MFSSQAKIRFNLILAVCGTLLTACQTTKEWQVATPHESTQNSSVQQKLQPPHKINAGLTIASWNVEHLALPYTNGCRPRSAEEIVKLKNYVHSLNADIIALQEVASKGAIEQIFSPNQWQVVVSTRPDSETYACRGSKLTSTQQKVAFAVRKGVKINQVNTLSQFGLDNPGLRHGLELEVQSDLGVLTLLNVHLKSGCFVDNYLRDESNNCKTLGQQAIVLTDWLKTKELQQTPYVLLGDFNHRLSAPYNQLTRQLANSKNDISTGPENVTRDLIGCHPYYPAPIDHIWLGHIKTPNYLKQARVHPYQDMTPNAMLSDHCALSVQITAQPLSLSNGVTWQTSSAEYRFLTLSIYQKAINTLKALAKPNEPWVVVMDVDETILNNSAYNVNLEQSGSHYSRESWNAWVSSKAATLVPGAKEFIETVLAQNGKLALITNRERDLDRHTWQNLYALGLPISSQNTCLIGRTKEDKNAVGTPNIHNDKDLRRQQITNGQASCYQPTNQRHSDFGKAKILMQVGDNIEDFIGITQEDAEVSNLITEKGLILLPNAMYGSW